MRAAIDDTGPLVALLDRAEQQHRWVAEQVEGLDPPLLVCEPVLAEAMHLLARSPGRRMHCSVFSILARAAGLHRNTISNIEVGRYAGDPETLAIIEKDLGRAGVELSTKTAVGQG
jgi:hypothetical protein